MKGKSGTGKRSLCSPALCVSSASNQIVHNCSDSLSLRKQQKLLAFLRSSTVIHCVSGKWKLFYPPVLAVTPVLAVGRYAEIDRFDF